MHFKIFSLLKRYFFVPFLNIHEIQNSLRKFIIFEKDNFAFEYLENNSFQNIKYDCFFWLVVPR